MKNQFTNGNQVQWKSSARGVTKTKVGEVVAIVPPNVRPRRIFDNLIERPSNFGKYKLGIDLPVVPRDHESYLVAVKSTLTGRLKLYYPRVNQLSLVVGEFGIDTIEALPKPPEWATNHKHAIKTTTGTFEVEKVVLKNGYVVDKIVDNNPIKKEPKKSRFQRIINFFRRKNE